MSMYLLALVVILNGKDVHMDFDYGQYTTLTECKKNMHLLRHRLNIGRGPGQNRGMLICKEITYI